MHDSRPHARRWASRARCVVLLLLIPILPAAGPAGAAEEGAAQEAASPGAASAAQPAGDPALALRAAQAALARGDLDAGVSLLAEVEERHAIVSDYAALMAAQALLDAKRWEEAAAVVVRFESRRGDTPLLSDLERVRGQAALGAGDSAGAQLALGRALDATNDPARQAPLLRQLAEIEEASGDLEAAAGHWLRLWRDLATQPAAQDSDDRLASLGRRLGRELRSAPDALARGDALFQGGLRADSVEAYDRALAGPLDAAARAHVARRRAEALFGLRRYDEARAAFVALGDDPEAEVFAARSRVRSGDVQGGLAQLLAQAKERPGAPGAQARWYAALLLDDDGETARARPLFESVAREASDPQLRADAEWRLAWADYRARRFEKAREQFRQLAADAPQPIDRLQARYWGARAQERAGKGKPADEFARVLADGPFTYYGLRAREWLARHKALPKPSGPRPALPEGEVTLGARDADRARILVRAGLDDFATGEIDRLATRGAGVADTLLVADLYREAGAYDRSQGAVLKRYADELPLGPTAGQQGLWQAAWPRAFADAVRRDSGPPLEPALVWALMREESGFRPAVASPAGAIGLMQLMPETASRVAAQTGLAGYAESRLVDPATNIRLGTAYLARLLKDFGGRASAAIGSYNAGPGAVKRWLAAQPGLPDDEWVESIPYRETRNYVRRVLRSRHVYRELYANDR